MSSYAINVPTATIGMLTLLSPYISLITLLYKAALAHLDPAHSLPKQQLTNVVINIILTQFRPSNNMSRLRDPSPIPRDPATPPQV